MIHTKILFPLRREIAVKRILDLIREYGLVVPPGFRARGSNIREKGVPGLNCMLPTEEQDVTIGAIWEIG